MNCQRRTFYWGMVAGGCGGRYRLGWIAYDPENPRLRVLFDSHPPKGAHFHVDDDILGTPFAWQSLKKAEERFFKMVCKHFNIDPEVIP